MTTETMSPQLRALNDIARERMRQDEKWGVQNHPDGLRAADERVVTVIAETNLADRQGRLTWRHILDEEVAEAYAEIGNDERLREELIQVAAVAVAWIEALDRR